MCLDRTFGAVVDQSGPSVVDAGQIPGLTGEVTADGHPVAVSLHPGTVRKRNIRAANRCNRRRRRRDTNQ